MIEEITRYTPTNNTEQRLTVSDEFVMNIKTKMIKYESVSVSVSVYLCMSVSMA